LSEPIESENDEDFSSMKHKIKYETKKKIREIVSAASNNDETLYKLLINEVEDRAERIKINM
jgi:hypothetical protein